VIVTNKEFIMVLGAMAVLFLVAVFVASRAEAEVKTIYLEDGSTVITDDNVFVFPGNLYTLTGGRANKLVIKPAIPVEVGEDDCGLTFGGEVCADEDSPSQEPEECDGLTFGGGEC
jgi:hypothetical protein